MPRTRPGRKWCPGCQHTKPLGQFMVRSGGPERGGYVHQVEMDRCRYCRQHSQALPGRGFR